MDFSLIKLCVTLIALARLYSIVSGLKRVKTYPLRYSAECLAEPCPDFFTKQWKFLQRHCCPRGGNFHCQMKNMEEKESVRICMDSVTCPPGYYANLMSLTGATLLRETMCSVCKVFDFQPHATPSHYFTYGGCHNRSIFCTDLNAFTTVIGPPFRDSTCKCIFSSGYRPVPYKGHKCIEFKSTSGCRCRHKPCPSPQVLNSEFRCEQPSLRNILEGIHVIILLQLEIISFQVGMKVVEEEFLEYIENLYEHFIDKVISSIGVKFIAFGCSICWRRQYTIKDGIKDEFIFSFGSSIFFTRVVYSNSDSYIIISSAQVVCLLFIAVIKKRKKETQGLPQDTLKITLTFTSQKICESTCLELKNVLPVLGHHYGKLSLYISLRTISVTVSPSRSKCQFSLLRFLHELLCTTSMMRNQRNNVTIVVRPDTSKYNSREVHLKLNSKIGFSSNTGEIILKLENPEVESDVLGLLRSSQDKLQELFSKYDLDFKTVKRGSLVFKFHLPNCSKTFDAMVNDRRSVSIAKDILSHTSNTLTELAKTTKVEMNFLSAQKLDGASVVYVDNAVIQVGLRNNVVVGDHTFEHTLQDPPFYSTDEGCHKLNADIVKVNVIRFTARSSYPDDVHDDKDENETNIGVENKECISAKVSETDFATISIMFCDEQTTKNFYSCWSDVLPLYRSRYPTCNLLFKEKTLISWRLRIYGNKVQDLSSFVTDLFSTVRIQEMVQRSPVTVNVIIPKSVSELIPSLPWEQETRGRTIETAIKQERMETKNCLVRIGEMMWSFALSLCRSLLHLVKILFLSLAVPSILYYILTQYISERPLTVQDWMYYLNVTLFNKRTFL